MHLHVKSLRYKRLLNTRDLGGLPTADKRTIACGKLIRSGKLYKLPQKTVDALIAYGVTTVIDLRIAKEQEEKPDTLWDGVKFIHAPLLCTATPGITNEESMRQTMEVESRRIKEEFGTADNYMVEMYRSILLGEQSQEQLKVVLRALIENDGCVLWHCSAGKDRAGIVAMLVESLLGVSEETIVADFKISSKFLRRKYGTNKAALLIAPVKMRFKKILYAMMKVNPRYIIEVMQELKERYGSVSNYCKQALGVTDGDVEILKSKYLKD